MSKWDVLFLLLNDIIVYVFIVYSKVVFSKSLNLIKHAVRPGSYEIKLQSKITVFFLNIYLK